MKKNKTSRNHLPKEENMNMRMMIICMMVTMVTMKVENDSDEMMR